jgi:opacity protein-like surface antigen
MHPSLPNRAARSLRWIVLACGMTAAWQGDSVSGGEIELKSLNTVQNDPAGKRRYGPYAGFFGGQNSTQTGDIRIGEINGIRLFDYTLNDRDNAATFGFEVGKTWRGKKTPLALSLEFEGSFLQTKLAGQATPESLAAMANDDVAFFHADMNAAFFMVNGAVSLDLWKYRARLGKFVAGMKPYLGAGFGGGQLWFRNSYTLSKDQLEDPESATLATSSPFVIDEFVTAWQWFGGIEYCWKDRYSVFAEYRRLHLGDLDDMTEFQSSGYALGFRYRY